MKGYGLGLALLLGVKSWAGLPAQDPQVAELRSRFERAKQAFDERAFPWQKTWNCDRFSAIKDQNQSERRDRYRFRLCTGFDHPNLCWARSRLGREAEILFARWNEPLFDVLMGPLGNRDETEPTLFLHLEQGSGDLLVEIALEKGHFDGEAPEAIASRYYWAVGYESCPRARLH